MIKKMKSKNGFTIIELIIVIAITATLALIAAPRFEDEIRDAKLIQIKSEIKSVESIVGIDVSTDKNSLNNWDNSGTIPIAKTYDIFGNVDNVQKGHYKIVDLNDLANIANIKSKLPGYFVVNEYNGKVYYVDYKLTEKKGNIINDYDNYMIYYGKITDKTVSNFERYQMVIIERKSINDERFNKLKSSGVDIYAYQSIMGVEDEYKKSLLKDDDYIHINGEKPSHKYFKYNYGDIRSEDYRNVLIHMIKEDVLSKGYSGVLLDTLDDVNQDVFRNNINPETGRYIRDELIEGYVDFLKLLKEELPHLSIIQNRGFEIYQAGSAEYVDAILFENFKSEDFEGGKLNWLKNGLNLAEQNSNSIIMSLSYESPESNYELSEEYGWLYGYYNAQNANNHHMELKEKIYNRKH